MNNKLKNFFKKKINYYKNKKAIKKLQVLSFHFLMNLSTSCPIASPLIKIRQ